MINKADLVSSVEVGLGESPKNDQTEEKWTREVGQKLEKEVSLSPSPLPKDLIYKHQRHAHWDFPGGPVPGTVRSQQRGQALEPWLGNWIPHATARSSNAATKDSRCHNWHPAQPKKKKKYTHTYLPPLSLRLSSKGQGWLPW